MRPLLNLAVKIARESAKQIVRAYDQLHEPVRIVDQPAMLQQFRGQIYEMMQGMIHQAYPQHQVLLVDAAEASQIDEQDYVWLIEPLDGALNFFRRAPEFALGIVIKYKNKCEVSVIYDCLRQDLFCAAAGEGARLNDHRIRVSDHKRIEQAILTTNFPLATSVHTKSYLTLMNALLPHVADMNASSVSLQNFAHLAAAWVDGYWSLTVPSTIIDIGFLLVKEAGGLITDLHGGENYRDTGTLIAANSKLVRSILATITPVIEL